MLKCMRIPKYKPYEEPAPRRSWTREEIRSAVRLVRDMLADEREGRDPHRPARIAALATDLGRQPQAVRMRLNNIVHVLTNADLPAPDCLPALTGVGRRTASAILDAWHELEAESVAGQAPARRPWTEAELGEALAACRRMGAMEARIGRSFSLDEAGDAVCETAARIGRRWSETRRVMGAVNDLADASKDGAISDAGEAELSEEEKMTLIRLLQQGE
jgi:hypothetical protein